MTKVSLIGAPTDIGAGARGASMGPEAMRVAQIGPTLEAHGIEVFDRGNLLRPGQPVAAAGRRLPPPARSGRLEQRRARRGATPSCSCGHLPILLGGDHCLGIGSISAVARHCRDTGKKLRILWLDAHADFNTARAHAQRQHPRHAGGLPVRPRPAGADRDRRPGAGDQPEVDAPDRHPQRRRRREEVRPRDGPRGVRHALHRRDGHAPHDGAGAGHARRQHAPARQLRRRLPRPADRPRRRHHRSPAARPTARRSCAWR